MAFAVFAAGAVLSQDGAAAVAERTESTGGCDTHGVYLQRRAAVRFRQDRQHASGCRGSRQQVMLRINEAFKISSLQTIMHKLC
jgi:hypothetical protein